MSQCCSAGGELIAAEQVDHHGTCHVTMAGQVMNERVGRAGRERRRGELRGIDAGGGYQGGITHIDEGGQASNESKKVKGKSPTAREHTHIQTHCLLSQWEEDSRHSL